MDGVKCSASRSFYPSLQHCGGEGGCALTKHTHRLKGKESDGCGFFGSFSRRRSITRIIIICVLLYFNEWNVSYPWINLRVISKTDPRRTMDVVILYFFLFVEVTHGLRYDGSNNLQPYMWVYFFFFFWSFTSTEPQLQLCALLMFLSVFCSTRLTNKCYNKHFYPLIIEEWAWVMWVISVLNSTQSWTRWE